MYGLADRITRSDTAAGTGEEGLLVPLFPHAGVMVLEQQGSSILELVRACVGTSCATVSAADAATALAQLPTAQPGVVVIDQSLDPAEAELLAGGAFDVAAELFAHRGDQLAAVVTLAARAEAFVQRGSEHRHRHGLVDRGFDRPPPLARVRNPAREFGERGILGQGCRRQV